MKILFIKDKSNEVEVSKSIYFEDLLKMANIEVVEIDIQKGFYSFFRNIFLIRNEVKKNQIQLIHCFNFYSNIIAFLGINRKKIVLSFFESEIPNGSSVLFKKLVKKKYKIFSDQVILENLKCQEYLGEDFKFYILPIQKQLSEYHFLPMNVCREKLNLELNATYILTRLDDDLDGFKKRLIQNSIKSLNNTNIKVLDFNIENHDLNCLFNAANLIITSSNSNSKSIIEFIENVLMTNNALISLDENLKKTDYENVSNLFFCKPNEEELIETIKSILVNSKKNSRDEIIQIADMYILKRLLYVYKLNYLWKSSFN